MIPVFYSERMVANISSFSPSASKPKHVMKSWGRLGVPIRVIEPIAITKQQFYLAHDHEYVDGVLGLQIANGFGNHSPEVAASLPWTSGAMLSATREAIKNGGVAVAPVSGFHHAHYSSCGGYCTFNGLMVTACVLLHEGKVKRLGIFDCDHHYGDGTQDILDELKLESRVLHYSAGATWRKPTQAKTFLEILPHILEEFADCDVLLYQAGADPHLDDDLGGWMTTEQLAARDGIVFETCRRIGLPVCFDLAGGYQKPLRRVLNIHDNTMLACARAFG